MKNIIFTHVHVWFLLQMFDAAVIHCVLIIMSAAFLPLPLFAFGISITQSSARPNPSFLILLIHVLLSLEAPLSLYSVQSCDVLSHHLSFGPSLKSLIFSDSTFMKHSQCSLIRDYHLSDTLTYISQKYAQISYICVSFQKTHLS